MTPMTAELVTFSDKAAVRVHVRNPYTKARRFQVEAFELNGRPLTDVVMSTTNLSLAPGAKTSVFVMAPLGENKERSIVICATSTPFYGNGNGLRGQVCGKYRVVRWSA